MALAVSRERLEFLKHSARTLFADSPSTSAYLMASHNSLLRDQHKAPTTSQQREFCPACGCLQAPGWTSSASTVSKKRKNTPRDGEQSNSSSQTGVVYRCLRCYRNVVQSFPKSSRKIPSQAKKISSTASQIHPGPSPQDSSLTGGKVTKGSENASSKKRAKARKNQGLLATLTAGKQQPQPQKPSPSLDLLDIFQQR